MMPTEWDSGEPLGSHCFQATQGARFTSLSLVEMVPSPPGVLNFLIHKMKRQHNIPKVLSTLVFYFVVNESTHKKKVEINQSD